jgi:hypothetical protein
MTVTTDKRHERHQLRNKHSRRRMTKTHSAILKTNLDLESIVHFVLPSILLATRESRDHRQPRHLLEVFAERPLVPIGRNKYDLQFTFLARVVKVDQYRRESPARRAPALYERRRFGGCRTRDGGWSEF